ncbi:hypothetical protein [Acrocarpospora catenulata]|uniref:hypothetical protein n=1 Tax=Acrocarpospora catenulata TaxID=2836182 RepID=UPI001BDA2DB8|nr:hypothetical protein [Acrocarpospora catenulata]
MVLETKILLPNEGAAVAATCPAGRELLTAGWDARDAVSGAYYKGLQFSMAAQNMGVPYPTSYEVVVHNPATFPVRLALLAHCVDFPPPPAG